MSDVTTILGHQRKAIKDEQDARHGATAALISGKARIDDLIAAGMNTFAKPLNTGTDPGSLNQGLLRLNRETSQGVGATDTIKQTTDQYRQAIINNNAQGGPTAAGSRVEAERLAAPLAQPIVRTADRIAGGLVEGGINAANKVVNFGAEVLNVMKFNDLSGGGKSTGSLGTTGSLIEDFGKGTLAMLHGKEGVITEKQFNNLAAGIQQLGVAVAVHQLMKSMKPPLGRLTDHYLTLGPLHRHNTLPVMGSWITSLTILCQVPTSPTW
jgi:hypothetical protein